jgi:maltose alpha-D-glucosyltransferase/alpha-amylase
MDSSAFFLLIEINYESGLPEMYHLPVTFVKDQLAVHISENFPQAVIAKMKVGESEGILSDALYIPEVQQVLVQRMAANSNIQNTGSEVNFKSNEQLQNHLSKQPDVKSRILLVDDANTSIAYDNCFLLKMYRYVERAINPDVELTQFLTEQVDLPQVPDYVGTIEWKNQKDSIALGMMQVMVEYHGNGRTYMIERLINYNERIVARKLKTDPSFELKGSLTDPISFDNLPRVNCIKHLLTALTILRLLLKNFRCITNAPFSPGFKRWSVQLLAIKPPILKGSLLKLEEKQKKFFLAGKTC